MVRRICSEDDHREHIRPRKLLPFLQNWKCILIFDPNNVQYSVKIVWIHITFVYFKDTGRLIQNSLQIKVAYALFNKLYFRD